MKNFFRLFVKVFFLLCLTACSETPVKEIAPEDLPASAMILDVRTRTEHDESSLKQKHFLVPLDELNAKEFIKQNKPDGTEPLYLLCRSGRRATVAAKKFKQAGFHNVVVIKGGMISMKKTGKTK